VGPFLELEPGEFSFEKVNTGAEELPFNPNHPWIDDSYWDGTGMPTGGGIRCEIIDAFARPLCYDKVKTNHTTNNPGGGQFQFFNPSLFQNPGGSGTAGTGIYAHPDAERYIVGGLMPISEDEEPEIGLSEDDMVRYRCDPRYVDKTRFQAMVTQLEGGAPPPAGSDATTAAAGTHAPKHVPGFHPCSAARSGADPPDDITNRE